MAPAAAIVVINAYEVSYPLYKNPNKALADSVRKDAGKRRTGNRNFDLPGECRLTGVGDCPYWNGGDECPVIAEGDEE